MAGTVIAGEIKHRQHRPATFSTARTAWAATDAKLFTTIDGGDHWIGVHDFAQDGCERIQDLAAAGANSVRVLVVCRSTVILYRSDDAGITWWSADSGVPGWYMAFFDPLHGSALRSACTPQGCVPRVARTSDGGHTWSDDGTVLPVQPLNAVFAPHRAWLVASRTLDGASAIDQQLFLVDLP